MKNKIINIVIVALLVSWFPSCTSMKIESIKTTQSRYSKSFGVRGVVTSEGKYVEFTSPGKWIHISDKPLRVRVTGIVREGDGNQKFVSIPLSEIRKVHWEKLNVMKTFLRYMGLSLGVLAIRLIIKPSDLFKET